MAMDDRLTGAIAQAYHDAMARLTLSCRVDGDRFVFVAETATNMGAVKDEAMRLAREGRIFVLEPSAKEGT
jgi:hypothetical protein